MGWPMMDCTWSLLMPAWTRSMFLAGTAQPAARPAIDNARARRFMGASSAKFRPLCTLASDKSGLASPSTIVGMSLAGEIVADALGPIHAKRFPFPPARLDRDAERADCRRPVRNADRRSVDERVRRSRGGAAVVRRGRPRDARLRARCGGQGPAGRRDVLYLAARRPRAARGTLGLHRAPLRHQMPRRPADGHDGRHAGDPAVVPASARSRRHARHLLLSLALKPHD